MCHDTYLPRLSYETIPAFISPDTPRQKHVGKSLLVDFASIHNHHDLHFLMRIPLSGLSLFFIR